MKENIYNIYNIAKKKERIIIGLMSGTSLDGLDVAVCKISNAGIETELELLHFCTVNYDDNFKNKIKEIFSKKNVALEKLTLYNAWVGKQHAMMINNCLQKWNLKKEDIALIASHGQTIYHAPKSLHQIDEMDNATLQIGDGDHIAVHTGIITISDFRQKQIAAGGEGAPLAVYGDYLLFSKKGENRIMLNIGGIANFTFLDADLDANKMYSTDVGPGNTMMDAVVQKYFPLQFYDKDAIIAKQGNVNEALLTALKDNVFFDLPFPKTTGPELFNLAYLNNAQQKSSTINISVNDVLATLCKISADVIVHALKKVNNIDECIIYTSGGGMHNPLLMQFIQEQLPNVIIKTTNEIGINPDAKEAILFAILANETVSGNKLHFGSSIPNVSMGKISFPN